MDALVAQEAQAEAESLRLEQQAAAAAPVGDEALRLKEEAAAAEKAEAEAVDVTAAGLADGGRSSIASELAAKLARRNSAENTDDGGVDQTVANDAAAAAAAASDPDPHPGPDPEGSVAVGLIRLTEVGGESSHHPGWMKAESESGEYYWNPATQATKWASELAPSTGPASGDGPADDAGFGLDLSPDDRATNEAHPATSDPGLSTAVASNAPALTPAPAEVPPDRPTEAGAESSRHPGWTKLQSESGDYYWNPATSDTKWESQLK